jgi:hypothetical protein
MIIKKMNSTLIYIRFLLIIKGNIYKKTFSFKNQKKKKINSSYIKIFSNKIIFKKNKDYLFNAFCFLLKLYLLQKIEFDMFTWRFKKWNIFFKYLKSILLYSLYNEYNIFHKFLIISKKSIFWVFTNLLLCIIKINNRKNNHINKNKYISPDYKVFFRKKNNSTNMSKKLILTARKLFSKIFLCGYLVFFQFIVMYINIDQIKLSDLLQYNLKNLIKNKKILENIYKYIF